jgi:hypothetical protein
LSGGFPHSDIPGSKGALASPGLIAECHVLHRLLLPRHPPNALLALDPIRKKTDIRPEALARPGQQPARPAGRHSTRATPVLGKGAQAEERTTRERIGRTSRSVYLDLERLLSFVLPLRCSRTGALPQRCRGRVPVPTRTKTKSVSCFALLTMSNVSSRDATAQDVRGRPGRSHRRLRTFRRLRTLWRPRKGLVGRGGVEPPTSRLSGVRSNHLSYRPNPAGQRPSCSNLGKAGPVLSALRASIPFKRSTGAFDPAKPDQGSMVEPTGIEPVTLCLQSRCSPS